MFKKNNNYYLIMEKGSGKTLRQILFTMTIFTVLGVAKCDMGEVISSCILAVMIAIMFFAAIGWWSRRNENK